MNRAEILAQGAYRPQAIVAAVNMGPRRDSLSIEVSSFPSSFGTSNDAESIDQKARIVSSATDHGLWEAAADAGGATKHMTIGIDEDLELAGGRRRRSSDF